MVEHNFNFQDYKKWIKSDGTEYVSRWVGESPKGVQELQPNKNQRNKKFL